MYACWNDNCRPSVKRKSWVKFDIFVWIVTKLYNFEDCVFSVPGAIFNRTVSWFKRVKQKEKTKTYYNTRHRKKLKQLGCPSFWILDWLYSSALMKRALALCTNFPIFFQVLSIQLPKDDRQDRMKGFGYIEFKDKSNLIAALQQGELVSTFFRTFEAEFPTSFSSIFHVSLPLAMLRG